MKWYFTEQNPTGLNVVASEDGGEAKFSCVALETRYGPYRNLTTLTEALTERVRAREGNGTAFRVYNEREDT